MANRDLQELPKQSEKWSFLYFEKGNIEQDAKSIAYCYKDKRVQIPVESIAVLLLGPGTTITHKAIETIANSRCSVLWVGENGVKFYALGKPATYSARNILKQVELYADYKERMRIVRLMYSMRFSEIIPESLTLDQLRGKEGARVRATYKELSEKYGIEWQRRDYKQSDWSAGDPANRALSAANSCLYGICHAAIVSLGYSPAIGFIHTGKQLSLVYDIADLYKSDLTIPIAFETASEADHKVESLARFKCRDAFREKKMMKKIIFDLNRIFHGDTDIREGTEIVEGVDIAVNY